MVRAAAVQMVSTADVQENLDTAASLVAQAAAAGAELVALPEFFAIISENDRAKLDIREPFGEGPLQSFLADIAREHGIWLIGGTIPITSDEPDRVYNACLVFDDAGECVARYNKIHLFDANVDREGKERYNESATMKHGDAMAVAPTPFGAVGLTVCYDLRFPELYRGLLARDAVIFSVPSAFTEKTGRMHWETLLRARAVENLSFVIAPAQGGRHNAKRTTWGHSLIVDPWGEILGELDTGPGFICADLDLDALHELRRTFPALQHRRLI